MFIKSHQLNIICNTCVGSALYKFCLKQLYGNPFVWHYISFNEMYKLIENYNTLNYINFNLIFDSNKYYHIIIDNCVDICYAHYRLDENIKTPTVIGPDLYYYDIGNIIIEKYKTRIKRFLENKNKNNPIFMIASILPIQYYTEEEIDKICKLCDGKYKLIIANKNIDLSNKYKNVKFIKTLYKDNEVENIEFAKKIYPEIQNYLYD